jgi:hypothetical protein
MQLSNRISWLWMTVSLVSLFSSYVSGLEEADDVEPFHVHGWIIILVFILQPLYDRWRTGRPDR